MTKTEAIIWRRIEEKAIRLATGYSEAPAERELMCWDAHCYKYINSYGQVKYVLSQEEFDKIKYAAALKEVIFELLYSSSHKIDRKTAAALRYVFQPDFPSFDILRCLSIIAPMWDDRNKKKP